MPCLLSRQEYLEKLQKHQKHYLRIEPQVTLPVAKSLVKQQLRKLKRQIKTLTIGAGSRS